MPSRSSLAALTLAAAAGHVAAQSISTGFNATGTLSSTAPANYFDLSAIGPNGLTVQSFDVNSNQALGNSQTITIWYKQGSYQGFELAAGLWTMLGQTVVTSAGPNQPTPVPLGGLHIPPNQRYGVRIGFSGGSLRNFSATVTPGVTPVINADARIDHGATQGNTFSGTPLTPRGWPGTIYYSTDPIGACCRPEGACSLLPQDICTNTAGTFQGPGTTCIACPQQTPGQWFTRTPVPAERIAGAGAIVGDTFYLIGGAPQGGILNLKSWKLDLVNDIWSPIADLPHSGAPAPQQGGVSNLRAAVLGTDIYLVGGYRGTTNPITSPATRLLRYDTQTDSFEEIASDPYPLPIFAYGSAVHNGKIYILGGHTAVSTPTNACYVYDPDAPAGTRWSPIASLDVPRAGIAAVAIGNLIYAVGGEATEQTRVDIYDIATNQWTQGPSMAAERGGGAIFPLDDKPYAVGGGWAAYLASGEILENGVWVPGPASNNPARSLAFASSESWLVRSGGYNGFYRGFTESFRIVTGPPPCYANCDGSTTPPILNVADFSCFLGKFAAGDPYANCDGSTQPPVLNVAGVSCFLGKFAAGCR